jgi:hypothetical protein
MLTLLAQFAPFVAISGTGVVHGTDTFCVRVLRPALARVDDATLTAVMGNVHRHGDRRMPALGILGIAAAAALAAAAAAGHLAEFVTAGVAFLLPVGWVVLHLRSSAPVHRILAAAVDAQQTPADARARQCDWDRITMPRAVPRVRPSPDCP